jgi:hypothetical protein
MIASLAPVKKLPSLQLCVASNGLVGGTKDVTQNCGLRMARFKLKSEARWTRVSETLAHLAVNLSGIIVTMTVTMIVTMFGTVKLTVKLRREQIAEIAPGPVVNRLSVACRLS